MMQFSADLQALVFIIIIEFFLFRTICSTFNLSNFQEAAAQSTKLSVLSFPQDGVQSRSPAFVLYQRYSLLIQLLKLN